MTEQEKFLKDLNEWEAAKIKLFPEQNVVIHDVFTLWRDQVNNGHVTDDNFSRWINSLTAYYGEKDRPFAEYLEGLLK